MHSGHLCKITHVWAQPRHHVLATSGASRPSVLTGVITCPRSYNDPESPLPPDPISIFSGASCPSSDRLRYPSPINATRRYRRVAEFSA
ncbi:hypothetical protein M440DRAFT_1091944 [Trichoderma longibrachiatum ATCC 18648]|uniref:Uncharacterized protein n=1 Tax=Trichoderma longibrachiatum ATCC 18648 TaxID=983965 RepID=A0A2T4BTC4_TRILO|nr:hypothetical protein M440DRAFT_1091944 [Trichoderma longibrachiatum ATCC 18648]